MGFIIPARSLCVPLNKRDLGPDPRPGFGELAQLPLEGGGLLRGTHAGKMATHANAHRTGRSEGAPAGKVRPEGAAGS